MYHLYNPTTQKDFVDLHKFFKNQIDDLAEKGKYSSDEIGKIYDFHDYKEIVSRIMDSNSFFLFVRDKNNKVIGSFESRQSKDDPDVEILDFIFLEKDFRGKGISSNFMLEFLLYCKSKNRKKIIGFSNIHNEFSIYFLKKFGFKLIENCDKFSSKYEKIL